MTIRKTRQIGIEFTPENIEGGGGTNLSREGELSVDSSDSELKVRLDSATRTVVTEDQVQTLTNKDIDADSSTISNLEVDNLKVGVLNVSTVLSGASDAQLPSALAVKTYVDNKAAAQNEASEISVAPAGTIVATNVQDALEELDANVVEVSTNLSNHISDTTDAHDASAISNIPSGNLAATDMQGAVNELQSDIDLRALTTNGSIITPTRLDVKQGTKAALTTYALTASNGQLVFATDTKEYLSVLDGLLQTVGGGGINNWVTAYDYKVDDVVIQNLKIYQALTNHTSGVFATDLADNDWVEVSAGVVDHTLLTNIGTNTHAQIDTHIANTSNPHAVTKTQVGLGNVDNTSDATKNAAIATLTNKTLTSPIMTNPLLGKASAESLKIDSYTTAQMNAIASPSAGLTIYNSDYKSFATYNGTAWTYGFGNLTVETNWEACTFATLAWQGLGTVTNNLKCRRQGSNLEMRGQVIVGTTTGTQAQIPLPTNYGSITTSSLISTNEINSAVFRNIAATQSFGSLILQPSANYLNLMFNIVNARDPSLPLNGNTELGSGETISVVFLKIPIEGWSSNTSAWVLANSNPILTTTEFSAKVSISGIVSDENVDWIDGNCSGTYPYVCNFKSSIFSVAPNCTVSIDRTSADQARVALIRSSTTSVSVTANLDNGTASTSEFILNCQRSGADYLAAHSPLIVGTFAGTPKAYGYTGAVDHWDVSYGATANTACSSGPPGTLCPYIRQSGGNNGALVTGGEIRAGSTGGLYDMFFKETYSDVWCKGIVFEPNTATAVINSSLHCSNCNSLTFRTLNANQGAPVDTWGSLKCTGYR